MILLPNCTETWPARYPVGSESLDCRMGIQAFHSLESRALPEGAQVTVIGIIGRDYAE